MKKKLLLSLMALMLAGTALAGVVPTILPVVTSGPDETHYYGAHDFSYDLGTDGTLSGRLEFAVYDGSQADDMIEWTGYQGEADYVYAYQVFCDASSTAALTYFALTGIDPTTIADIENDISETESLKSGAIQSGGVEPTGSEFNDTVTKAIWHFEDGMLGQGQDGQTWFLFLYTNSDWIAGDMEVRAAASDDIPVPQTPEPATLALLLGGSLLAMKRKK